MVAITCVSCQMKLSVKEELAGKRIKCPGCGQSMLVPGPVAKPAAAAAAVEDLPTFAPAAPSAANPATEQPTPPPPGLSDVTGGDPPSPEPEPEDTAALTDFLAPPQSPKELGRLGDFRILKILGHGGMGVVFQGEDLKLGRKVAIKAMLPHLAGSKAALQRFLREARMVAALEHDHIVPIHHIGEDRGAPFIVMPFLKGEPLDERLKRDQKLAVSEVLRIGREIALGLEAAHAAGLIHRDIKPANVWLEGLAGAAASGGRVKILDFGLARASAQDKGLTQQGAIVGTPTYMAPEQACGGKVGPRSDLWSLGVLLYRASTGRLPFEGTDTLATLMAAASEVPAAPAALNSEVPAGLSELVVQLLAKDPAGRPGSAQEVVQALRQLEQQQLTQEQPGPQFPFAPARPAGSLGRTDWQSVPRPAGSASDRTKAGSGGAGGPARRRRRALVLGMLGALVAILAVVLLWLWRTPPIPVRPDSADPGQTAQKPPLPAVEAQGLVRLDSNDAGVEIVFDQTGPTVKGAAREPIKLAAGEHGVLIKRGNLSFETAKLQVKKGETIALTVEVLKDKIQVKADGRIIGVRDVPPVAVAVNPPGPPALPAYTNKLGMAFALVPKGKSWLGGGAGKVGTKEVEIRQDFYLGVYEVTQEEWEKVMGNNPSQFKAVAGVTKEDQKRFPVEKVSWNDAQAFVKRLNEQLQEAGWEYRLPTEEEWEYACRGGPMADKADSAYGFYFAKTTNELKPEQANFNKSGVKRTCKVGSYAPNRLGLYDMHGNVWEWTSTPEGSARAGRGGGWGSDGAYCAASSRHRDEPGEANSGLGFRLLAVPSTK